MSVPRAIVDAGARPSNGADSRYRKQPDRERASGERDACSGASFHILERNWGLDGHSRKHPDASVGDVMAATRTAPKRDVLQTLQRGLAVLEVLAQHPRGITPKTASATLGINLSTTYHLLNTLLAAGYAVQSPETRLFQLGPRVATLGTGFIETLRVAPRLLPFVQALQQATGGTAILAQWENGQVTVSAVVDGDNGTPVASRFVGFTGAAHAMAAGKVLMAWAPTRRIDAYLANNELRRYTPATITTPTGLRAELRRVAQAGYGVDREECGPGHSCVAAPVFSADGTVTEALSIMTTTARFTADESRLVATTLDIARAASFAMGADPSRHMRAAEAPVEAQPAPNGHIADRVPVTMRQREKPASR